MVGWSVVCVSVHECGFVMECRTANPSRAAVPQVHLATQPFTELAILCEAPVALTSAFHCVQTS